MQLTLFLQQEQKVELQLFHLYHNEKEIQSNEEDLQHKQSELTKVEKKRQKAEEALKEKKKEAGTAARELAKIEQEIREVVSGIFVYIITNNNTFYVDKSIKIRYYF